MNKFASASRRKPIETPIVTDTPNAFQQRQHVFKRRCKQGRWLHQSTGFIHGERIAITYEKPKDDPKS